MLILTILILLIRRLFITRLTILIYLFSSILLYNGYCHNYDIILYNNLWVISYNKGIIGICILLIASFILKQDRNIKGEKSIILSLSIIGIMGIISSNDWILFILSLELLTYSTSIIACMDKNWESTRSAGLKYFLIGAFSSGFILLGITLLYSKTGLLQIMMIEEIKTIDNTFLFLDGWNLILAGLLFKIGAAPFHYWAPDVYDGVPTIITSWIAIFPKLSLLIFIYLWYKHTNITYYFDLSIILYTCWLSFIFGSFVGLIQYRIKRLLAYSSISHIGFILLGILSLSVSITTNPFNEIIFYIIQYALTSFTIFFILMSYDQPYYNIQTISQLKAKINNNVLLALIFNLCLFSLAGLPPFVGFFAKISILQLAIFSQLWFIVFTAIITSVIGSVQYLRIINLLNFYDSDYKSYQTTIQSIDKLQHNLSIVPLHPGNINSHIISFICFFIILGALI